MAGHTPGPWKLQSLLHEHGGDRTAITARDPIDKPGEPPWHIASVWHGVGYDKEGVDYELIDQAPANARLIAAAPDLLGACLAMLATWGSQDEESIIAARDLTVKAIDAALGNH